MSTEVTSPVGGRRRRRRHSDEFKAEAVAACRQPGVSMAAIALARGVNANLLRRWVQDAERAGGNAVAVLAHAEPAPSFVPLGVEAAATPAQIHVELQRGTTSVKVAWPSAAAAECAAWLRELLR